jgi:hypothetical protein
MDERYGPSLILVMLDLSLLKAETRNDLPLKITIR